MAMLLLFQKTQGGESIQVSRLHEEPTRYLALDFFLKIHLPSAIQPVC